MIEDTDKRTVENKNKIIDQVKYQNANNQHDKERKLF